MLAKQELNYKITPTASVDEHIFGMRFPNHFGSLGGTAYCVPKPVK